MKKLSILTVLLFGLITQKGSAQSSTAFNVYGATYYLGYDAANPGPINFTTAGPPYQMTFTANGDLNIIGGGNGYMIGSSYVLWTGGATGNILVGVNAGTVNGAGITAVGYNALHSNASAGNSNTAVGYQALTANTIGYSNTAIGWGALIANVGGYFNTASGQQALYDNTGGINNTANGYEALDRNQSGNNNTAIGMGALAYNLTDNNNALGVNALFSNTTGTLNTAIGIAALYSNLGYSGNTAVGDSALYYQTGTSALNSGNVAVGNSTIWNGTSNSLNTAVGEWAMRDANSAEHNTALGYTSLYSITNGINNTAGGAGSMFSLTTAVENTAFGYGALYFNKTGGDNVAVGEYSLQSNLASANTAVGTGALQSNTTGISNTAVGTTSLGGSTGSANTAIGNWAGMNNAGDYNTFLGDSAGAYNTTGYHNTYVGHLAGDGTGFSTVSNTTCLGDEAGFSATSVVSNSIYLGNNAITNVYAVPLGFSAYSDRRIKDSIKANVPGLAFINRLKPVTYNLDIHKEASLMNVQDTINWPGKYDVEKIKQSGFIAQAVDSAAQACKYNFSGLGKPQSPNGLYTLGYTTFVVPLVKAVQELSAKNDTLHDSIRSMRSTLDSLRTTLKSIQTCLNQLCGTSGGQGVTGPHGNGDGTSNNNTNPSLNTQDITLSTSIGTPLLYQNAPNPFSSGTKINYYLPEGTMGASIIFYDTYGNTIKTVQLSQTGNGTLNTTPDNLSNGIYSYSLIVNGAVIDTKKMLLQK